jgi:hypothetical protein
LAIVVAVGIDGIGAKEIPLDAIGDVVAIGIGFERFGACVYLLAIG